MKKIIFSLLIVLSVFGCQKDAEIAADENNRTFYLGVTPWPADFTTAEVDTSYAFINNHCDIVSHHFDDGVPYEEAFNNLPMPTNLQNDVQYRKTKTNSNKKILLSVSALNLTRKEKADYYSQSNISASIKSTWNNLPFDNANVITAYFNYVSWLVDSFHPNYVNFGVESNNALFNPSEFTKYKYFLSQVYSRLKIKYPNIPLFISFMVDESPEGYANASQLIPYTDYIGLSAYPYVVVSSSVNGNTNPALFPSNFFDKFIALSNKPLVFAETSYIAENLVIPSLNLNKQGNENWQNDYLQLVCTICNKHNAKFLIWFCSKDYDAASATLQSQGLYQDLFGLWQDTGLKNQNGRERLAYKTWLNWMSKTKVD
jgi:hypothetical protein